MTGRTRSGILTAIQALRGIGASLVVFAHFSIIVATSSAAPTWMIRNGFFYLGSSAMDIFFVISGFIIVYTTQNKSGARDCAVFVRQRFVRVFPLYWIATTLTLAARSRN